MLEYYLTLAGNEIANTARLRAYVDNVALGLTDPINLDTVGACGCPTLTAEAIGDDPYLSPENDAPWHDPDVPESADFYGLMVLSVEGMDNRPYTRDVTRGVTGHAAFGRPRLQPRTVTVTALILASTCCGSDFGLRWLGEALAGCADRHCDGDELCLFSCCPTEVPDTPEEFERLYGRTVRRVALTEGPTVIARNGDGCSSGDDCQSGADVLTVEFVLTAAVPWMWTCPEEVLNVAPPLDTSSDCIDWCVHDPDEPEPVPPTCFELSETCNGLGMEFTCDDCPPGAVPWPDDELCEGESPGEPDPCSLPCRLRDCPDPQEFCRDDSCAIPAPPTAPPPLTCFCQAIAVDTDVYELDLTNRPGFFPSMPIITVDAGSSDLRRLTIVFYERIPDHVGLTCEEIVELERCNPHSTYEIGYVPAGGTLTIDGQVRRTTVTCGGVTETSPDTWGRDGGPVAWELLNCGEYCVAVSADAIFAPAPDGRITVSVSGREY